MRRESCSSLRIWRTCKRKYHYKYEQKLEPVGAGFSKSLVYGTLVHAAMEDLSGVTRRSALCEERDLFKEKFPMNEEDIEFYATLAYRVMAIWKKWWLECNLPGSDVEFLEVEKEWEFPLAGCSHVGKRDGYVQSQGKQWLYELKTTVDSSDNYMYRLWMDDQLIANHLALVHEGKPVAGAVYDIVYKHQLRQKKTETIQEFLERIVADYEANPGEYFKRVYLDEHIKHAGEYSAEANGEINDISAARPRPRNLSACSTFGQLCPYFELCSESDDGRRTGLIDFNFKPRANKFPELTDANQGQ